MAVIGNVESLWRYPVKSMRGEELNEVFVGFAGIYGDRLFAFRSTERPKGFPYLTGREQKKMVLYRPRFRHPDRAAKPPNLAEAESIAPGLSPVCADPADLAVDIETPLGEILSVDDPALLLTLGEGLGDGKSLTLLRSERAMTDCRPLDPDTAERNPAILGKVTKVHDGKAGVYGAVLVEGMVRVGDNIEVLN